MKLQLQTTDEAAVIASRRSFLTRLAYGSLLAMSGSIAQAAVKHAPKKNAKSTKSHTKASQRSHSSHKKLAAHTHSKQKHTVLSKNKQGHHLDKHSKHTHVVSNHHHHDEHHSLRSRFHERLAMRDHNRHARIHHTLDKDYHHEVMQEFELQDDYASRSNIILPNSNVTHRALSLQNTTTGDSLNVTYFEKGRYLPDALDEINYLYRDHLTDEIHPIDTALLDQLHDLQATLGINKRQIHVICGYRSPYTNAHLRRRSRGVAKNSLHMQGRAIDIRMPGISSRNIRDAALSMARGGVGYYPGSNFVHLDTGGFRTW